MKSLEEVIQAYTLCENCRSEDCEVCPYFDSDEKDCRSDDRDFDSFYWLKQYQEDRDEYLKRIKILQQTLDIVKYPDPLPWEFFPLRKGKPVWIKFMGTYSGLSRWAIITRIEKDKLCFTASDGVDGYNGHLYKRDMGKEWEIYTKEVKNENI